MSLEEVLIEVETARPDRLNAIYQTSEYYSARYAAGKALGNSVDSEINGWLGKILTDLTSRKIKRGIVSDAVEKQVKAARDLAKLYELSQSKGALELLKTVYEEHPNPAVQHIAGQAMGYSQLRLWVGSHERVLGCTTACIISAAIALGAAYIISR